MHDAEALEAKQAIKDDGRSVVLLKPGARTESSGPAFDRNRNGTVAPVESTISVLQTRFKANEVDGDLIRSTDVRYLVPGDVVLSNNMQIRDGNQTYSIKSVSAIKPGPTTILNIVQAR